MCGASPYPMGRSRRCHARRCWWRASTPSLTRMRRLGRKRTRWKALLIEYAKGCWASWCSVHSGWGRRPGGERSWGHREPGDATAPGAGARYPADDHGGQRPALPGAAHHAAHTPRAVAVSGPGAGDTCLGAGTIMPVTCRLDTATSRRTWRPLRRRLRRRTATRCRWRCCSPLWCGSISRKIRLVCDSAGRWMPCRGRRRHQTAPQGSRMDKTATMGRSASPSIALT